MPADEARTRVALIHSPLTGALLWRGVADALAARSIVAFCARLPEPDHAQPPYWLTHAATVASALPEDGNVVLVAHSGAGVLLPAIAKLARNRTRSAQIVGFLFVDCDLPRDGASRLDLMSPELARDFRERSRDGWLPRWTASQLAPLIPDAAMRSAFVADLPRVPLAMYEEAVAVPDEWPSAPVGYIELSPHYPDSVATAIQNGWQLRRIAGHHLLPYTAPQRVAGAIADVFNWV